MPIIITNGNTTLGTANGFARVEASNLAAYSNTGLALTTSRAISATFANAGNCQGVLVSLVAASAAGFSTMRPVTARLDQILGTPTITIATPGVVTLSGHGLTANTEIRFTTTVTLPTGIVAGTIYFVSATGLTANTFQFSATSGGASINTTGSQSGVHTLFATQAQITLTASELCNGVTANVIGSYLVPFIFTSPFAVDTVAAKWQFFISQGAGTNGWTLRTSDATNIFFASWCNNLLTATANDTLIIKDVCTIDVSLALRGTLGTGDAVRAAAIWICKHPTDTNANTVSLLRCLAPAASYTLTVDGAIILGAHSGFRAGTNGLRIPTAQKLIINFISPTVGTIGGFQQVGMIDTSLNANGYKMSLFFYGQIPTDRAIAISADAAAGQANLTLATAPSTWVATDRIIITKSNVQGTGDAVIYAINTIAGTALSTTVNLAQQRRSGGFVINLERYGIQIYGWTTSLPSCVFRYPNNLVFLGCDIRNVFFNLAFNGLFNFDQSSTDALQYLTDSCACYNTPSTIGANRLYSQMQVPLAGMLVQNNHTSAKTIDRPTLTTPTNSSLAQGVVTYINNIVHNAFFVPVGVLTNSTFSNNAIHNVQGGANACVLLSGANSVVQNNDFYGIDAQSVEITNFFNPIMSGNKYNNILAGMFLAPSTVSKFRATNEVFGDLQANTVDVTLNLAHYAIDCEINSPTGNLNIPTTSQKLLVSGSLLTVTDWNDTSNDDRSYLKFGFYQRTGFGLSDTLVWNGTTFAAASAGQFGLRLQPNDGTNLLTYQDNLGSTTIGNCQNLAVTVSVRIKINNAAYYAGVHVNPALRVTFDGVTQVTAVSTDTTGNQQLQVTFTPTTTSQFITIQLEMATDATTSNAHVYLGEVLVLSPSGVLIDTTRLGNWKSGIPLGTLRTFQAPASAWSEPTELYNTVGTFGVLAKRVDVNASDIPTLL